MGARQAVARKPRRQPKPLWRRAGGREALSLIILRARGLAPPAQGRQPLPSPAQAHGRCRRLVLISLCASDDGRWARPGSASTSSLPCPRRGKVESQTRPASVRPPASSIAHRHEEEALGGPPVTRRARAMNSLPAA